MIQVIRRLLKGEDGAIGMLIVIGFMALSIPLITSALGLAGTFSTDSQVKNRIAESQYNSISVAEYVRYLASDPDQWDDWLDDTGGVDQFTVNGQPTCFSATEVQSSVSYSPKSDIKIKKEAIVVGDIVSAGAKVKIDKEAVVTGDIRAGKDVEIKKESIINGNIWSSGKVKLEKDARVNGNITAAGTITLEQGAVVTGSQSPGTTPPYIVPTGLLTPSLQTPGTTNFTVTESDPPLDLAPGSYGKLDAKKESTVILNSGQYSFTEFEIDKEVTINLEYTTGDIVIDINGKKLDIDKEVQMAVTSGSGSIMFRVDNKIDVAKEASMLGTFLTLGGIAYQVTVTDCQGETVETFEIWGEHDTCDDAGEGEGEDEDEDDDDDDDDDDEECDDDDDDDDDD